MGFADDTTIEELNIYRKVGRASQWANILLGRGLEKRKIHISYFRKKQH